MATPLSLATLNDLPDAIKVPTYARGDLSAGIVHIGLGNFHRAHMAVYLDDLFAKGLGRAKYDLANSDSIRQQCLFF